MGASPDAAQQTVFYDNTVASPSMKYEYDAIYRLTYAEGREHAGLIGDDQRDERDLPINNLPHANDMSAVRRYEETYEYDLVGNFESFAHVAVGNAGATWTRLYDYGVGKPNNRLQTNSLPGDTTAPYTAAYTYDGHGNCLSMPHLGTIDWDPSDLMRRADLGGGGEVFFTYDAAGQRVRKYRKHIGTLVEERIYLGAFELYRKRLGGTLQVERETLHVMDGVRRVAMIETKTVDTAVVGLVPTPRFRFQLGNHLETAHLEVDETGLVISYEEMHPYGTSAYRSAASAVEVSARRYRYTGKERDDESGLDYFGARYYASWVGRWVSADPLGVQAGINLYLYCRAGPVVFHDPDGRHSLADKPMDEPQATESNPLLLPADGQSVDESIAQSPPSATPAKGPIGTTPSGIYQYEDDVYDEVDPGQASAGAGGFDTGGEDFAPDPLAPPSAEAVRGTKQTLGFATGSVTAITPIWGPIISFVPTGDQDIDLGRALGELAVAGATLLSGGGSSADGGGRAVAGLARLLGLGEVAAIPLAKVNATIVAAGGISLGTQAMMSSGGGGGSGDDDGGGIGSGGGGGIGGAAGVKLTPSAKKVLRDPALQAMKDKTLREGILARGGGGTVARKAGALAEESIGNLANRAAAGDTDAEKAIKLLKDAKRLGGKDHGQ